LAARDDRHRTACHILMIRLRHKLLVRMFRLTDQLVLILTALGIIRFSSMHGTGAPLRATELAGLVLLALGWVLVFDGTVRYRADRFVSLQTQLGDLLKATTGSSFWLLVVSAALSLAAFGVREILAFFAITTAVGVLSRLLMRLLLVHARSSGYNYRFVLVIGANERARRLARRIEHRPELGCKIVGFLTETGEVPQEAERRVLGTTGDLKRVLKSERVDELLVSLPMPDGFAEAMATIATAGELGITVRVLPDLGGLVSEREPHIERFDSECVLTFFDERRPVQMCVKRMIDAGLSFAALVLLAPLMLMVALLVRLGSPGPVLFAQERVGLNQRRFRIYKFRTMVADAEQRKPLFAHLNEADGPAFKIADDPRITPIGRLLRRTSIDELPQLINVLLGEMSLVGPRPPLPEEVGRYDWPHRKRLSVKPGITCLWQISGRHQVPFDRWMKLDREYVENWSLWLDLKILALTIPAVILAKGAS
jgi:exopolysaccharide biosynthesis polyprenyl glycosylphosphotransferase